MPAALKPPRETWSLVGWLAFVAFSLICFTLPVHAADPPHVDTQGVLRAEDANGKRWKLQLEPDAPPSSTVERDWISRDTMYFRLARFEQSRLVSNIWQQAGGAWPWFESPSLAFPGSTTTEATVAKCGMRFDAHWTVLDATRLQLDVIGTPVTPGLPCAYCVEIADFDQRGPPPEPVRSGDWTRSTEGWRVRFWLVKGTAPAAPVKGSLIWECGPQAAPLFPTPAKEFRAFSYAELPDVRPFLGPVRGWGTNICGSAIHNFTEDQVLAESKLLQRLGYTTLRLAHFDSFGGKAVTNPDGTKRPSIITDDATGFRRWVRLWPGNLVLDGMHGLGDDSWKGRVWIEPEKWAKYLAVRACVIDSVEAEKAGGKVLGWCDINENTVESPWWTRFNLPDAERDAKAKELYAKILAMPPPASWTGLKYRSATQAWGAHPAGGLGNLSLSPAIAGNNYMTKPGVIDSGRSLEWYIDQHRAADRPSWITEWNNATAREGFMADAFMAPVYQALLCVDRGIECCCDFAWTQNETIDRPDQVKPWECRLNASKAVAMVPAAIIFSNREKGFRRADGTLYVDTPKTHGQVGVLRKTARIVPQFDRGIVLVQELPETSGSKRLITVLGRSKGTKPTDLQLERCDAYVDGRLYHEGLTLVP